MFMHVLLGEGGSPDTIVDPNGSDSLLLVGCHIFLKCSLNN